MAEQRTDTIEALEEILRSLRIIEDNKSNQSIEPAIPGDGRNVDSISTSNTQ